MPKKFNNEKIAIQKEREEFIKAVEEGLKDVREGRVCSIEDAKKILFKKTSPENKALESNPQTERRNNRK